MTHEFPITRLGSHHNKEYFDCGNVALNNYLKCYAKQDIKKHLASVYVAADDDNNVVGYYTLSASALPRIELPHMLVKHISYAYVPVMLIGRLAVDKRFHGKNWVAN